MADFAINCSKEIQRHRDLDHIGIDDHKIPNTHRAGLNSVGRHDQNGNQTQRNDQRLAKIQEGQGIAGFQCRFFIAAHRPVIPIRLALFGAEIFDGFKVKQAINRLLVGICVLFVHLAAQFYAPFGDRECEPHINSDGDENCHHIFGAKDKQHHCRNPQEFQHQWAH